MTDEPVNAPAFSAKKQKSKRDKRILFPISGNNHLKARKSLLETFAVSKELILRSNHAPRSQLRLFLHGAEVAWKSVRREIERGDLAFRTRRGLVQLPLHADLPSEFQELCALMGWRFHNIVPGLNGTTFEDCRNKRDKTDFVEAVCDTWRRRPHCGAREMKVWIENELHKAGWTVN